MHLSSSLLTFLSGNLPAGCFHSVLCFDLLLFCFLSKGQKLWAVWTHQVHPPGGPGHHVVRLGLGPGERSEQQVLQAEGGRREGRVWPAHSQEEEDLRWETDLTRSSLRI